jgi:hypothetical protein
MYCERVQGHISAFQAWNVVILWKKKNALCGVVWPCAQSWQAWQAAADHAHKIKKPGYYFPAISLFIFVSTVASLPYIEESRSLYWIVFSGESAVDMQSST